MQRPVDVAIIGAGPYGLSVAAHLRAQGVSVRIFGSPMQAWRESMPAGMRLKSEGFASSLSDPRGEMTLGAYCAQRNIPYAATGVAVPLELFVAYGEAFQKQFAPQLENTMVTGVEPAAHGYDLRLQTGEVVAARKVVVASGIRAFDHMPAELSHLPSEYLSHSAAFGEATHLAGRDVVVVGGGSSAVDVIALLRRSGARVRGVTRRSAIRFQSPLGQRSLWQKIKAPMTGLGPGWKSVLCVKAPLLFHAMPEKFRVDVVRRYLGPAPGWFVRDQIEGHVPFMLECDVIASAVVEGRVHLTLRRPDKSTEVVTTDHVVAATGYQVDLRRLAFLGETILKGLRLTAGAPALSRHFESSLTGLYFVGTAAANSFGPMLRFAYGADYAARRVASHLARGAKRGASGRVSRSLGAPVAADLAR
jgi:thioredoxin reductase